MEAAPKIGVGPDGPAAGLLQFATISILGVLLMVYGLPLDAIVLTIIPASLFVLVALGQLALLGDNFPLAPPGGSWNPEKSRVTAGLGMTVIWAVFSGAMLGICRYVAPGWPMSPLYLWFGVIAFWLTLLYGINWNGWPFKGKLPPWGTMFVGFSLIMIAAMAIWTFLTNLDGTPLAASPMNHHGPLNVNWLTGYLVWAIAWFFVLNPVFATQGWPFGKLGHPGAALAQTVVAHVLSLLCWNGSLAMGMSPSFSFGAIASSIIFWCLVYSWHLRFWGISRTTHPVRAILAVVVIAVLVPIWIALLTAILGPAAAELAAAKLPADINILIIYVNLCVVGPVLIAHNAFWLRWPLTLPTPPGTPPPDQTA